MNQFDSIPTALHSDMHSLPRHSASRTSSPASELRPSRFPKTPTRSADSRNSTSPTGATNPTRLRSLMWAANPSRSRFRRWAANSNRKSPIRATNPRFSTFPNRGTTCSRRISTNTPRCRKFPCVVERPRLQKMGGAR